MTALAAPATVRARSPRVRPATTVVSAAVLVALGVLVSASVGELRLPLADVARVLAGQGDPMATLVVREFRLPRVAAAVVVGAGLALSGAILQSLARNPLASPDVLGINAGASVAAVSVVILAGSAGGVSGLASAAALPVAALVGAIASGLLLHLLALRGRTLDPMRMVVIGVGISAGGTSLVSWLLTLGDVTRVGAALTWLSGSLHTATWPRTAAACWALVLAVPLLLVWARRLDSLELGDDTARGHGVSVDRTRVGMLLLATALAGAAVSAAGAVAFVALAAPQLARGLAGTTRPPLLGSALVGAALLLWADLAARMALSWLGLGPIELPVGVLTAFVGAPYLLYLVSRERAHD